jgi:hypothetical protein
MSFFKDFNRIKKETRLKMMMVDTILSIELIKVYIVSFCKVILLGRKYSSIVTIDSQKTTCQ